MDAVTQELDAISKQHDRLEVLEKYVEGREKITASNTHEHRRSY